LQFHHRITPSTIHSSIHPTLAFPEIPSPGHSLDILRAGINEKDKKGTRSFLIKSDLWGDGIDGEKASKKRSENLNSPIFIKITCCSSRLSHPPSLCILLRLRRIISFNFPRNLQLKHGKRSEKRLQK
jgi:hypothetical protein